ncbi:MAG: hypothetical protein RLZZ08_54 [Pseudomonadota bacterium]|jgi:uncharacterized phiE125 gp8 family phage protein
MKRAILAPAPLAGAALAELKDWLAITTPRDDAVLTAQLRAALEMCEAFTGQMPLAAQCEEVLPASAGWQALQTMPIQAITSVQGIPAEGARFAIAAPDYAIELDAGGGATIRLLQQGAAGRIAVRFTAGIAADWSGLPDMLRQGVLRLAAHQHRQRDNGDAQAIPPAAVAALWRPWRRMRLA